MIRRSVPAVAARLLRWYDRNRRDLPWRYAPGARADPYRVWLSEIMLQQTTVAAVKPYFARFLARWPTVRALAAAPRDDVLAAWAGLGYYARARNLHACAAKVVADFDGRFPKDEAALRSLPGIGAYTAAAVAAIAFGRPAMPVDGNIERVMARLHAVATPLPAAKTRLGGLARALTPKRRAGDLAQALMDLGATICTPRAPDCLKCPLASRCHAQASGNPERYPRKTKKTKRPIRHAVAFVVFTKDKYILLRKRNDKGLLGGMAEIPTTPWTGLPWGAEAAAHAPLSADWKDSGEKINHIFTHFVFETKIMTAEIKAPVEVDGYWRRIRDLHAEALPSVMRKIVDRALKNSIRPVGARRR